MKLVSRGNKGFTLIELVMVVSLVVVISGFILYSFKSYSSYQQYNQAVSDVEFNLNQVKLESRIAADDVPHGVKFTGGDMILFQGDAYVAADPDNELISYELVAVTVELSDGVDEIVFSKLAVIPNATGTITVTGTAFNASTTFTVSDSGVIQ